jgi:hypothetical protein
LANSSLATVLMFIVNAGLSITPMSSDEKR